MKKLIIGRWCLSVVGTLLTLGAASLVQASGTVLINQPLSKLDPRYQYTYQLLSMVFEITEKDYGKADLKLSPVVMHRTRTLMEMIRGETVHVMAEAPKPDWDDQLLTVAIPIRKGVQGIRLFFVHRRHQKLMSDIMTLEQLAALPTGSGQQWSTRKVMADAGFDVVEGPSYEGLFKMLGAGRFTTFGRGVNEIYREHDTHKNLYPELRIDNQVALHIPLPTYFYVTPQRPQLAQRIQTGMERLMDSGAFDRFFYEYHCADLVRADLHQRRIFRIENPNLNERHTENADKLWLNPRQDFGKYCAAPSHKNKRG